MCESLSDSVDDSICYSDNARSSMEKKGSI